LWANCLDVWMAEATDSLVQIDADLHLVGAHALLFGNAHAVQ